MGCVACPSAFLFEYSLKYVMAMGRGNTMDMAMGMHGIFRCIVLAEHPVIMDRT